MERYTIKYTIFGNLLRNTLETDCFEDALKSLGKLYTTCTLAIGCLLVLSDNWLGQDLIITENGQGEEFREYIEMRSDEELLSDPRYFTYYPKRPISDVRYKVLYGSPS
jgi:hypothetical protein